MPEFKKSSGFRMKGYTYPGSSPMTKTGYSKQAENLLKAVPDEEAYNKLTEKQKKAFDKAAKKAGLPTKRVKA
tara:strand:+ start:191 stop:409 length:219 start_codon:yes stop_codon:yes gene_type:complete